MPLCSRFCLALSGALALSSAACGPPIQNGTIVVLPGATERLIVAMELGYRGVGDVKPPATVHRIVANDDLVGGAGATGKRGDYVLENGTLVAIVSSVDGRGRGGELIDVARMAGIPPEDPAKPGEAPPVADRPASAGVDEIARFSTSVLGSEVHYTTLKTGKDAETGAAYVEVSGIAGPIVVSTRYDVAPEVDAVLVHTSFTRPLREPNAADTTAPDTATPDIADDAVLADPASARIEPSDAALALYGAHAAYAVVPLSTDIVTTPKPGGASIGVAPGRVPDGLFIYTRMVTPLDRSDSLSFQSAVAVSRGEPLGDVELEVAEAHHVVGSTTPPGVLLFRQAERSAPLELRVGALHVGDVVHAKAPAGAWEVSFDGGTVRSVVPTAVVVRGEQVTRATVLAGP